MVFQLDRDSHGVMEREPGDGLPHFDVGDVDSFVYPLLLNQGILSIPRDPRVLHQAVQIRTVRWILLQAGT